MVFHGFLAEHVPRHLLKMPIDAASLVFSGSSFQSTIVLGQKYDLYLFLLHMM